jgi:hypothetical protein
VLPFSHEPARHLRHSLLAGVTPAPGDEAALRACAAAGVKVSVTALSSLPLSRASRAPPAWAGTVCVKTLTGKSIWLSVHADLLVEDVKTLVQDAEGARARPHCTQEPLTCFV